MNNYPTFEQFKGGGGGGGERIKGQPVEEGPGTGIPEMIRDNLRAFYRVKAFAHMINPSQAVHGHWPKQ